MRKNAMVIFVVLACMFLAAGIALAQESLTITTYYPSPYGVYKQLRLSPTDDFTPYDLCTNEGEMYYDTSENAMYVCSTLSGTRAWRLTPGGGATWSLNSTTNEIYNTFARNVGIGTTDPQGILELYTVNADVPVIFTDSPVGAGRNYVAGIDHSALAFIINRGTTLGTTTDFTIDSAGRVGVGRAPTTYPFEVQGDAGKTVAGGWQVVSDVRAKTGIQDIVNPLSLINRLHPIQFRYAPEYEAKYNTPANKHYYSFIAQEFGTVFPESVQKGMDGYLTMDSDCVKSVLVAAVQEMARTQEKQAAEIGTLKKEIEELKAKLDTRK